MNKPSPCHRDHNRDPNIKALKGSGFINHGSTFPHFLHQQHVCCVPRFVKNHNKNGTIAKDPVRQDPLWMIAAHATCICRGSGHVVESRNDFKVSTAFGKWSTPNDRSQRMKKLLVQGLARPSRRKRLFGNMWISQGSTYKTTYGEHSLAHSRAPNSHHIKYPRWLPTVTRVALF